MTEHDWLGLDPQRNLAAELADVVVPQKLFLLGSAFLRRVEDLLNEAERTAVETTERFARGQTNLRDLLETWTNAELETGEAVWVDFWTVACVLSDCPCCQLGFEQEANMIHAGVREAGRSPAYFAARAARHARALVRDTAPAWKKDEAVRGEALAQYLLYRDIVGEPCDPLRPAPAAAADPTVRRLLVPMDGVEKIDRFDMLALADALEEAGCTEEPLLDHCRNWLPHGRGCWLIEVLMGRSNRKLALDESRRDKRVCRRR
jgi:hypothetical protein